jgi:hypothetical protein
MTSSLPPTILGVFGRQRPLTDVLHKSIDEACKSYGFPIDPILRKQIADRVVHNLIRAYTPALIRAQSYVIVPLAYEDDPEYMEAIA